MSHFAIRASAIAAAAAMLVAQNAPVLAAPRFLAVFQSGKRLEGTEIRGWHETLAEPLLDAQRLVVPADRLLWIEDRASPPAETPPAFVEFSTGDRLPCQVIGFRTGREGGADRQLPPHFLVVPSVAVDVPGAARQEAVVVLARWLRRVVWQRTEDDRYQPRTVRYRDGRQLSFRSLRWSADSLRLLLEQETREIPFGEIAEVHLPPVEPWEAWLEQMALVAPGGAGTLVQVETVDGMRLTTSLERFQVQSRDATRPEQWFHGFQLAWSLEPLWLPHRTIRVRRFFEAQRPPLTLFEPTRAIERSSLGGGWSWQRDRSSQRLPLKCAAEPFGWGLGVHAYSELTYELPTFVREFRTQYGLDQAAGRGGSVRASVFAGPASGVPLHQSPVIIGSTRTYDTGPLSIPEPTAGAKQLTLVVDPLIDNRPAGSDPFEIRDLFDWLQPTFGIDPPAMRSEISRRFAVVVPAWQDWTLAQPETRPVLLTNRLDATRPQLTRYISEIAPRESSLTITRRVEVAAEHRRLALTVSRFEKETTPSRIEVRIDGQAAAEFEVPIRKGPGAPAPLFVPIEPWQGRSIAVEIVQRGDASTSRVEWHGIALVTGEQK